MTIMKRVVIIGLLALLVVSAGVAWWLLSDDPPSNPSPRKAAVRPEEPEEPDRPQRRAAPSSARRPRPAPPVPPSQTTDRQRQLLDQIRSTGREEERLREAAAQQAERDNARDEQKATLDKEQIKAAIHAVTPMVQECYEQRLQENQSLQGKAVLQFTIVAKDGQGQIDDGEVKSSSLGDLRLETCLLHQLTKARFPMPQGDGKVTVSYPFTFKRSEQAK